MVWRCSFGLWLVHTPEGKCSMRRHGSHAWFLDCGLDRSTVLVQGCLLLHPQHTGLESGKFSGGCFSSLLGPCPFHNSMALRKFAELRIWCRIRGFHRISQISRTFGRFDEKWTHFHCATPYPAKHGQMNFQLLESLRTGCRLCEHGGVLNIFLNTLTIVPFLNRAR